MSTYVNKINDIYMTLKDTSGISEIIGGGHCWRAGTIRGQTLHELKGIIEDSKSNASSNSIQAGDDDDMYLVCTPTGGLLRAGPEHRELLIRWQIEFAIEAQLQDGESDREYVEKLVDVRLRDGFIFVWVDRIVGRPVSMVSISPVLDNLVRICLVYCSMDNRGKGYATSMTRELCRYLSREGKASVLYTDDSNPIANAIYKKIGFEAIGTQVFIPVEKVTISSMFS